MSDATVHPKMPTLTISSLAAAAMLAGLGLVYWIQDGHHVVAGGDNPANSASSPVIAQPRDLEPHSAVNPPLGGLAARTRVRHVAVNLLDAEVAPNLAQLHRNMAAPPETQAEHVRLVGELDGQHRAETVDAAWSAQSEIDILSASIQPVMTEAGLSAQDIAADCRSSTCRISARFAEAGDAQSWGNMLITQMAGSMSQARMAILPLPDGSSEIRIYGVRKDAPRGQ